jgi:type II secretory pathway component HofQ
VSIAVALIMQVPLQRPALMPVLPLTQLEEGSPASDLDMRTFSLTIAQPRTVQDLLLLLVRGIALSIVPDPGIGGTFVGELKNVTVRQALALILRPLGLDYTFDGTVIRVSRREPETRLFDLNYLATGRVGQTRMGADAGPNASVTALAKADVFEDLANGVRTLLTERATFNIDRKAGLLQVTDFSERLDRVATYLDTVKERIHRQVLIDVRVIEVEPTDANAPGIDWQSVSSKMSGALTAGVQPATHPSMNGLRVSDVGKLLALLGQQGTVTQLANPRLLTLNNEPSVVRSATMSFSVTPQIAGDSVVTLSVTPVVSSPAVFESDMLARVADGETLVVSGFTRDREVKEKQAAGVNGGWFGRKTVTTHKHVELVILLTAKVVAGVSAH